MELQIQLAGKNKQLTNTDPTFQAVASEVYKLSVLQQTEFSEQKIDLFTDFIIRLRPQITPEILSFIVDGMALGLFVYDKWDGVQNIFKAFDEYKSTIERLERQNDPKQHYNLDTFKPVVIDRNAIANELLRYRQWVRNHG